MSAPLINDPSQLPLVAGGVLDPPIAAEQLTAASLRQRFALAGEWSPELLGDRVHPEIRDAETPRESAVLIPLFDRGERGLTVLMTVRSAGLRNHAGQIAFPGGRVDPDDDGPVATALREANEEVGLEAQDLEILGVLHSYRTGTGYAIAPVVALVDAQRVDQRGLRVQETEVADVFEVPLPFLMDPVNHQRRIFQWTLQGRLEEREFYAMPWRGPGVRPVEPASAPEAGDYFIWGATAALIRNLYGFLRG